MSIAGQDFLHRLEDGLLPKVVLFHGEEEYWIGQGISILKKRLFPHDEAEFNLSTFEAGSLEADMLKTVFLTPPFLSPARMVIISGLEEMKSEVETELIKGLNQIPDGVYLLVTTEKADQRRKVFKELVKGGTVVDCKPLKGFEVKKWLTAEGKKIGLKISPVVAQLLVERRGTSLRMLAKELEKARLYLGEAKDLSLEEWADLVGGSTESNIFALIDYTSEGNSRGAVEVLHQLLTCGEPEMKILFMLGKQIHQLFQAWLFLQEGRGRDALQHELKFHPFVAEKLARQARTLSYRQLRLTMDRVLQAEYRIKRGMNEARLELEMVVLDLSTILAA